ncbi:hypothetical protein KQI52_11720 [bacterium]|nr:hypothetical protein [bacterium]
MKAERFVFHGDIFCVASVASKVSLVLSYPERSREEEGVDNLLEQGQHLLEGLLVESGTTDEMKKDLSIMSNSVARLQYYGVFRNNIDVFVDDPNNISSYLYDLLGSFRKWRQLETFSDVEVDDLKGAAIFFGNLSTVFGDEFAEYEPELNPYDLKVI